MEFRILGSLEVVDHGRTADLGPPQRRALLAILLLNANQVVSVDLLLEGLWAADPPANPMGALQVQVSRLRKALAGATDDHSLVVSRKPGYGICIASDALDAWRFERLVADAVEALAEGRPAVASQMLTSALGLWRGPALSDFAYASFAQADVVRLNELRLAATESLMEAKLILGAHRDVVAELEALSSAHPLRERFWTQRMLALYRSGRQAEALRAYQDVRQILAEEVGLEPSPELSRLETAILVHHPELNWAPVPVTSREARRLPGVRTNPAAGTAHRADNLPLQLTRFIGRTAERAELVDRFAATRLLTLTGVGGCGKSRLAMQVAIEAEPAPADGVWLVDLSSLADPGLVTRTVAAVLGIREEPGTPLGNTVTRALARKHLVLVLDNCEHVLAACAALVSDLLADCEGLRILTTSREALGVPHETAWPVPTLSLPVSPSEASYEAIRRSDAVQLFVDRATLARLDFALAPDNARTVASICERLDGMALAIELAAARVSSLSLPQIAAGLDDRFRLLTGGGSSFPARHQALRQAIDWGHDLLTAPQQALLRRLSVFSGGFTVETGEAVCADGVVGVGAVSGLLDNLVTKSFVVPDPLATEPRFRLLDTIRHYGREQLAEAAETTELRERHGAWFVTLAERAEAGLSGSQRPWLERLEADHDNLRAAFERAMALHDARSALRLAGSLVMFWRIRGHYSEGREWCEAALLIAQASPPSLQAKARWGHAFLAAMLGDFSTAITGATESLSMFRHLGDDSGAARALLLLGNAEIFTGDPLVALPLLEESVALARQAQARAERAVAEHVLHVRLQGDEGERIARGRVAGVLHPARVMNSRNRGVLHPRLRIGIPARVEQYKHRSNAMFGGNRKKLIYAPRVAFGITLPGQIMEKHAHRVHPN